MKDKYAAFARRPEGHFAYPVGRASVLALGYRADWVARVPEGVASRFVGVGNPFASVGELAAASVLDIGCGCGFDCFVAAQAVGERGRVVGIDLTPEMVRLGRDASKSWEGGEIEFVEASADRLPFPAETFQVVISNGVMNLVPNKEAAYAEIFRVLAPGGVFSFADLLRVGEMPADVAEDPAAWAT